MTAAAATLAMNWAQAYEPAVALRASARSGGRGPQDPGSCISRRLAWPDRADQTRVSNRSRRRRDRTGTEPDSQQAVPV